MFSLKKKTLRAHDNPFKYLKGDIQQTGKNCLVLKMSQETMGLCYEEIDFSWTSEESSQQ